MEQQKKCKRTWPIVFNCIAVLLCVLLLLILIFNRYELSCCMIIGIEVLIFLTVIFDVFYFRCFICCCYDCNCQEIKRMELQEAEADKERAHELVLLEYKLYEKTIDTLIKNKQELSIKNHNERIQEYLLAEKFIEDAYRYVANGNGSSSNSSCGNNDNNSNKDKELETVNEMLRFILSRKFCSYHVTVDNNNLVIELVNNKGQKVTLTVDITSDQVTGTPNSEFDLEDGHTIIVDCSKKITIK